VTAPTGEIMGTQMELQLMLDKKDAEIRTLQLTLRQKDEEIQQLHSQLDKYQSVFPSWKPNMTNMTDNPMPRKQRAQGISAEPQVDLSNLTFIHHAKTDR